MGIVRKHVRSAIARSALRGARTRQASNPRLSGSRQGEQRTPDADSAENCFLQFPAAGGGLPARKLQETPFSSVCAGHPAELETMPWIHDCAEVLLHVVCPLTAPARK
eukprot:4761762-Alexandrium_andersonii.AAC.1